MRKTLPLILIMAVLFTACNREEKEERKISKRNYDITKELAYNDLFLDSLDVVKYMSENNFPDSIANRITSFYNTRNYEYAWFSGTGVSEQGLGFISLLHFTDDTSSILKETEKTMDGLLLAKDVKITEANEKIRKTELFLTTKLISYSKSNFKKGYVKRRDVEQFIPFVKVNAITMADSLLAKLDKEKKDLSDISEAYRLLSDQLRLYVDIAKNKKWMIIDDDLKTFKKGNRSPVIAALKSNLTLVGDIAGADTSDLYDDSLETGIKSFQERNGFTPDGKVTKELLALLNVSPEKRVKQLLVNMNRVLWLPAKKEGRLIMVNTPAFMLQVFEDGKQAFSMPVVVGKEGHNTTLFSDMLSTIVFSPYWNIPPSIVKSEILPSIENNPDYLELHNMEITKEVNGLPEVRQKPGGDNSLGKVKFLFPNSFNIYFHDTPAKSLFNKDVRAYSHGCIRLAEPEKLANYLLEDDKSWTSEKIRNAMNSGEEQYVKLKEPVPVSITYYTAWVENGKLNFRDDIYGHDAEVEQKMFL